MTNEIIQQLIKDDSGDIKETPNEDAIEIEQPVATEQEMDEKGKEQTTEEMTSSSNSKQEEKEVTDEEFSDSSSSNIQSPENESTSIEKDCQLAISHKANTEEEVDKKVEENREKEEEDSTDIEQEIIEEEVTSPEPHKPIIMDRRKTLDYSPSFQVPSKLLGKRQSIDPVRIKACGVSNVPDITKKSTDYVPSEARIPSIGGGGLSMFDKSTRPPSRKEMTKPMLPPDQPRPFVTTPNPTRNRALWEAPNLARLIASNEKSPGKRPDSAQSNSTSTTTTSCTLSLSEADSGVSDLSSGSRRSSGK